ncbi:MAG: AsnC family protein, partial [Sphingomonadales bacterium]|nr:AsnC family protein [Sphingomonadales bacterium]
MGEAFAIDDIDRSIVAELRRNGRATNQQIADT